MQLQEMKMILAEFFVQYGYDIDETEDGNVFTKKFGSDLTIKVWWDKDKLYTNVTFLDVSHTEDKDMQGFTQASRPVLHYVHQMLIDTYIAVMELALCSDFMKDGANLYYTDFKKDSWMPKKTRTKE